MLPRPDSSATLISHPPPNPSRSLSMCPRLIPAGLLLTLASFAPAADDYKLGPDSERQDGVPQGKVTKHKWKSKIFPGTERDYWVYVPAQYDGKTPACVMVFQDGGGYAGREGPVPRPGRLRQPDPQEGDAGHHRHLHQPGRGPGGRQRRRRAANRSFEYDTLSRPVRTLPGEGDPARGGQGVQAAAGRGRAGDRRHQLGRHLRVHRRLGAAGPVQQGAQPRRQLHQHPRRRHLPRA